VSGGISSGLDPSVTPAGHERADDEKTTLDQAERWATLLGAQLAATPAKAIASEPTTGWRAGAGDMTPRDANVLPAQSGSVGVLGAGSEAAAATENRMIVRVDGGILGEVALIVDRNQGAIRVTISAQDAAAEAALGSERALLMQALQSHGITVDSVDVVRANNVGTLPAQRSVATRRARDLAQAESKDDEHARRRLSRKLNLIG
jgi:hypothetical protein